jgi:hypothetical protein
MLTRCAIGTTLLLALALAGCGAQKGETRVKWEKGHEPMMTTAAHDGDYALFTMTDVSPQIVQPLHAGDPMGFEATDNGRIRAIAGSYSTVLPDSTMKAYWKDYSKK